MAIGDPMLQPGDYSLVGGAHYQKPTAPTVANNTGWRPTSSINSGIDMGAFTPVANAISSGGEFAAAGSAGGPVGAIVGGAVGLIKGIITEVAGGAADRRDYQERMNKFNRDMRRYYDNANKYAARMREQEEKQERGQRNQAYMADRQKRINSILQSINQRASARQESTSRWR